MRLAWATDIHLNFLGREGRLRFYAELAASKADAIVITGDLAEAGSIDACLVELAENVPLPVHFVLGNHDFYHSWLRTVRARVAGRVAGAPRLTWLTQTGVVPLTRTTGLLGQDGWYDGRLGDYAGSTVRLADFALIADLAGLSARARLTRLHALGDEAAAAVRTRLPEALGRFEHVIFATHVPPFAEACWHEGKISDAEWLPFFSCQAVGEALRAILRDFPDRRITVLCGHTHSGGEAQILPNLLVKTGAAVYGRPGIVEILEFAE